MCTMHWYRYRTSRTMIRLYAEIKACDNHNLLVLRNGAI